MVLVLGPTSLPVLCFGRCSLLEDRRGRKTLTVKRVIVMAGGFDSLGLMAELVKGVDELGWILPSDVQDEAIPLILGGGDVMVASETGSGKTAAFGLPMIQCVHERLRQGLSHGKQADVNCD